MFLSYLMQHYWPFPPRGQARMDSMLAGALNEWFATLKFCYYRYTECSVVASPRLFHLFSTIALMSLN